MNPNKIPYSANRKVVWWNGYNTAIEEVLEIIRKEYVNPDYIERTETFNRIIEDIDKLKSKEKQ